jgi:hypothetical protein
MDYQIDISKLDKSEVLAALYNNAQAQGLGVFQATAEPMTKEDAANLLISSEDKYFDYVKGRVMKVDLSGDTLSIRLYDRDNGQGAAQQALRDAGLLPHSDDRTDESANATSA